MLAYKESDAGPDPARGHQRGRLGRGVHRGRHVLRHARRADDPDLHLLLDVRLPAHRRPHLGGRRPDGPRLPHRRHRRAHDADRRGPAARRRALARCSPRPTPRSSPTTRPTATRSRTSSRTGCERMYGEATPRTSSTTSRSTTSRSCSRPSRRTSTSTASCAASTCCRRPTADATTAPRVQLLASGVGVPWALEAQELLREDWGVRADVWSVTSWTELRRDGAGRRRAQRSCTPSEEPRGALRHPAAAGRPRPGRRGVSDYMRAVPDQIAPVGAAATSPRSAPTASASPTPGRRPGASSTSTARRSRCGRCSSWPGAARSTRRCARRGGRAVPAARRHRRHHRQRRRRVLARRPRRPRRTPPAGRQRDHSRCRPAALPTGGLVVAPIQIGCPHADQGPSHQRRHATTRGAQRGCPVDRRHPADGDQPRLVPRPAAEDRSWVGLVAQAGIGAFIAWYGDPAGNPHITADVFGTAPRELTRSISLAADPGPGPLDGRRGRGRGRRTSPRRARSRRLREAILRYSREIAFAAAEVYARGGRGPRRVGRPARGARRRRGPARRGRRLDAVPRRRPGLGTVSHVAVVVGTDARTAAPTGVVDALRRGAPRGCRSSRWSRCRDAGWSPSSAASTDAGRTRARRWPSTSATGPIVVGPTVPHLFAAGRSARAALAGLLAAPAWPDAPRPVAGRRPAARAGARRRRARPAAARRADLPPAASPPAASLLETAGGLPRRRRSLEATARELFVHPNTVRYRLRPDRRRDRLRPDPPARGLHRADRPRARAGWPSPTPAGGAARRPATATSTSCRRHLRLVGTLQIGPRLLVPFGHDEVTGHRQGWITCSSSSAPDRAPRLPASSRPGSSCPGSATGWAGSRRSPGSTWSPTAPCRTPRRSGHRGRPAAASSAPGWSACSACSPSPATRCGTVGAIAGHSVGEITAAAAAGVLSAEQAMVLRPRARPGHGRRAAPSPRPA